VTPDKKIVWEFFNPFYYKWGRLGLTNLVFKAHRYGVEFEGLKGKKLDPKKFEWVLKEGGQPFSKEKEKGAEEVRRRLKQLGY